VRRATEEAVDAGWATLLGCEPELLHEPGVHLVAGSAELRDGERVFVARVGVGILVHCPDRLRDRSRRIVATTDAATAFSAGFCARIADVTESEVLGPSWHGFVDGARFVAGSPREGRRLDRDNPVFDELRLACGEDEWEEGGFLHDGVFYGIEEEGRLVAAGNMTPYRGLPADVGLVTRPDARGRGLAKRLAATMVWDALSDVGIVRYRALVTNVASLRIAESLGFERRGENYVVRLDPGLVAAPETASAAKRNPPRSSASTSDAT
jgi:RimJ/RimL family protein N-acetyltransferase